MGTWLAVASAKRRRAPPGRDKVSGLLPFQQWGGFRVNSGRKPKDDVRRVPHVARPDVPARWPLHVTVGLVPGLRSLRRPEEYGLLLTVFARRCSSAGFRLVHYSVQTNHVHLIVEADDRDTLRRGLQGLFVSIARALNTLWQRKGRVFRDRFHARALRTPREVRNALRYVLQNARHHGRPQRSPIDMFTSAPWFDGWREPLTVCNLPTPAPVARAETWLLATGWRRLGLLAFDEVAQPELVER